jgi:hypothetical protein
MEVLQLIAEGKANKETASELGIGIKTVEKHREHIMQKLDIHDTAGFTRYAISAGNRGLANSPQCAAGLHPIAPSTVRAYLHAIMTNGMRANIRTFKLTVIKS